MASSAGGGIGGTAAGLAALSLVAAGAVALTRTEPRFVPLPVVGTAAAAFRASGVGGKELAGLRAAGAGLGAPAGAAAPAPGKMALVRKGGAGAPEGGSCGGMGPSSPAAMKPPPAAVASGGSCGGAMAVAVPVVDAVSGGSCGMAMAAAGAGAAAGGSCGCGGGMRDDDGSGGGCGCGGAGAAGGGSCGCGGGDVTATAARGKGPHEDHTAHHGGYVGMLGDVHVELVRTAVHEWRLYLSDAVRAPVDAAGGTAELEFFGDTGSLGKLALVVSINGKFFAGRMNPPAGSSSVTIRASHPKTGPVKMDMAFPPIVPAALADGLS